MEYSLPGSSVHGIAQARIPGQVAISTFRRLSQPRDRPHISCIAGRFFTEEPLGKPHTLLVTISNDQIHFKLQK